METSAEVAEEVKEEAAEAELLEWNGSSEVAELVDDGVDSDVQEMDSSMATESEGLALNSEEISPAGSGVEGVPENEEGDPVLNEGGRFPDGARFRTVELVRSLRKQFCCKIGTRC